MRSSSLTLLPICLALGVSACGKRAEGPATATATATASAPAAAVASDVAAPKSEAAMAKPAGRDPAPAPAATPALAMPQLAYSYSAEIEASAEAASVLVARHEAACRAAGAAVCQVTAMSVASDGGVRARLGLRAQPEWLQGFRGRLAADAKAVGGRVLKSNAVSEDLSRQLVDTEAALRAKTLLAQRLEGLLANRQGKLSDLMEVEKQLSDTQGEIDAARSELAMMRARVATSEMTVDYTAPALLGAVWAPATQAVKGATLVFASGVGMLISLAAAIGPFALLGGLIALLARWFVKRKSGKGAGRKD